MRKELVQQNSFFHHQLGFVPEKSEEQQSCKFQQVTEQEADVFR